jgi:hypothetical protein
MWNKMRLECVFIIVEGCASLVCRMDAHACSS